MEKVKVFYKLILRFQGRIAGVVLRFPDSKIKSLRFSSCLCFVAKEHCFVVKRKEEEEKRKKDATTSLTVQDGVWSSLVWSGRLC